MTFPWGLSTHVFKIAVAGLNITASRQHIGIQKGFHFSALSFKDRRWSFPESSFPQLASSFSSDRWHAHAYTNHRQAEWNFQDQLDQIMIHSWEMRLEPTSSGARGWEGGTCQKSPGAVIKEKRRNGCWAGNREWLLPWRLWHHPTHIALNFCVNLNPCPDWPHHRFSRICRGGRDTPPHPTFSGIWGQNRFYSPQS